MKKGKFYFEQNKFKPGHFYASSLATWVTGTDPEEVLNRIRKEDNHQFMHTLWFVPVPEDTPYEIEFYQPQVEGAVFLGFYYTK